jgi:hypothetical protein
MKALLALLFLISPITSLAYFGQPYAGDLQYTLPYSGKNNATIFPNGDGTYTAIYHGSAGAEFGRNTTGNGEFPFGGSIEFTINADGSFTQGATKTGTAPFTYPVGLDSADIVSTYGFYFWPTPEPTEYVNPYQPPAQDWYSSSPAWTPWTPEPPPEPPPENEMSFPIQTALNLILIGIAIWFGNKVFTIGFDMGYNKQMGKSYQKQKAKDYAKDTALTLKREKAYYKKRHGRY